jgi:integrase
MTTPTKVRGQGRIYTRNGHFWIAYYHRGTQIRESVAQVVGKNTRAAAEKLLRARTRTAGTPDFVTPANERLLVEPLLELVVADYRRQGFRSRADVERHVRRLAEHFAGWRAITITTVAVNAYIDQRRDQGAANATINRETAVLRRGFRLAITQKLLSENHRPTIPQLPEDNARQGFLDPADFAALCTHLPPWLADATTFAYWTGWRTSEIKSLTWADVTLGADGAVTIRLPATRSKNKAPRTVVVNGVVALAALLARLHRTRRLDCPFVFHRGTGRPLGDFRDSWHRATRAAGRPELLFHDLRRSAVRNLVRAGVPRAVARLLSGHKSELVFERYNIVDEEDLTAAFDKVGRYVTARQQDAPTVVPLTPRTPG